MLQVEVPELIVAGSLMFLAAGVHGIGGQILVVRELTPDRLAPTAFGGPLMTRAMLGVSWHLATVAFLAAGCSLVAAGTALDGEAARAAAIAGASEVTACAAVILVLGVALTRSPRSLIGHPAPLLLTATALLAWVGAA